MGHMGHCSKMTSLYEYFLYSWPNLGIHVFYHSNQNVLLHYCSMTFCKAHVKPLPQVALTCTSSCIHEEEGKYVVICINRYQIFATNISNSQSQSFLRAFRQAKLSISFSQFRTAVISDSNARPTETAVCRTPIKSSIVILVRTA